MKHSSSHSSLDGLLWISNEEPNLKEYSDRFNNFTKQQFLDLPQKGNSEDPILFFTTNEKLEFKTEFAPWIKGKYLHLKWLTHHGPGSNIDVDFIALVGFDGKDHSYQSIGDVPGKIMYVF